MNQHNDEKIRELLKRSIGQSREELERDLWPQMLRRLEERSAAVPWFDWALLALMALCLVLVPNTIPLLLYHL
ncbi:MAG: hypothetical protein WBX03_12885 [Terriglobales bacterium]|jgi:hypothetical protein